MGIFGQDWASYQDSVPDTTGLAFAFVKITEGLVYINPKWKAQRDDAKAHGLVWGAYHYPHMGDSARAEADFFLAQNTWQPGDIIVLDWEGYDAANQYVSAAAQLAYKEDYLQYMKSRLPHNPVGTYMNVDYWNRVDTTGHVGDFLWIATANRAAGDPGIRADWLFHQYGGGDTDLDYCRLGSTAELRAWALSFQPPAPTPQPSPVSPGTNPQTGDDVAVFSNPVPAGFAFDVAGDGPTDPKAVAVIPLPFTGDTRWPYTMVDLSFSCDFVSQDHPVKLRLAIHNRAGGWRVQDLTLHSDAGRIRVWLQPGDEQASVGRVPLDATDTAGDAPVTWCVECH